MSETPNWEELFNKFSADPAATEPDAASRQLASFLAQNRAAFNAAGFTPLESFTLVSTMLAEMMRGAAGGNSNG